MRIIVTQQGKDLIDCLNGDNSVTTQNNQSLNAFRESSIPNLKIFNSTSTNFKRSLVGGDQKKTQQKWNKNEMKNAPVLFHKMIPIRQHKMNIPKNLSDKYNIDEQIETKSILPNLPGSINKKIEKNTKEEKASFSNSVKTNHPKFNLTIKDIISEDTIHNMKRSVRSRNMMRSRDFILKDDNFRTNYKLLNEYHDIDQKVKLQINPNHINLITYLNSKKNLSDKFFNRICNLHESEMTRLNRVCLKVNSSEQNDLIFKKNIEEKIEIKSKENKVNCARDMEKIGESLKKYRDISQGYQVFSHKEALIDSLYETKTKYWDKFDIERFYKRKETREIMTKTISVDFKQ